MTPAHRAARNAAGLWHHVLSLSELQTRVFVIELGEEIRRARAAVVLIGVGCLLGLGSLPVLLSWAALALTEAGSMTPAGAFGVVSALAAVVSAALIGAGWGQLRRNAPRIARTREEWKVNWRWLKETVGPEDEPGNRAPTTAQRSD
ncbi:MAG: phage holin family protein [Deltaproteobacteria bacterium]